MFGHNLVEHLVPLVERGDFELLLNEPGTVLVTTELDDESKDVLSRRKN